MKKENKLFIFYLFLIVVITSASIIIITNKNRQITKLEKSNKELRQEVIDYKWQIEQVPYIIESWCNGE
ncbi:MAG: hypothetical protein IJV15_00095 [Lachnospiraceae bacterium]|nr:hypothetical protein [Lachnospiraceae bacterium]